VELAGPEDAKNLAGKCPPPDSDPFSDAEFEKIQQDWQRRISSRESHEIARMDQYQFSFIRVYSRHSRAT
jgi:hypothetical protein